MQITDADWVKLWSPEPFPPSAPRFVGDQAFGTPREPESSLWCASIMAPLKDRLSDGFSVLDWGCGHGRLFNFLSKRFQNFTYYGLERPGDFGAKCVMKARSFFGRDKRAAFDVYGAELETKAVSQVQIAVMGSIATHLSFPAFEQIVDRLLPIIKRGGVLVSSFFIQDKYELIGANQFGHADCYALAIYTQGQLDEMCARKGLKSEQKETYLATGCLHRLIHFTA